MSTYISEKQISAWVRELGHSEEVRDRVIHLYKQGPVRKPSKSWAVTGVFSSRIMPEPIPFGSHTCELSFLWQKHDPAAEARLILAEPTHLRITTKINGGSAEHTYNHVPDYFLLTAKWAGFIQCKWESEIKHIIDPNNPKSKPGMFVKVGGRWTCPPCDEAAAKLGLKHEMFVMTEDQVQFTNNLTDLDDYFDQPKGNFRPDVAKKIKALVKASPGILFCEIRDQLDEDDRDTLFFLVARREIYVDLENEALSPNYRAHVYPNRSTARAADVFAQVAANPESLCMEFNIRAGTEFFFGDVPCRIMSVIGNEVVVEKGDLYPEMLVDDLVRMLKAGKLKPKANAPLKDGLRESAVKAFDDVDPEEWDGVFARKDLIQPYLDARSRYQRNILPPKTRTIFRYIRAYRAAEAEYGEGYGFLGLREKNRPGRGCQLDAAVAKIINEVIDEKFISTTRITKELAWGEVLRRCEAHKPPLTPPSKNAVYNQIRARRKRDVIMAREGPKSANAFEGAVWTDESDELSLDGEHAWASAHIDHTQMDCETAKTPDGLSLGRPWLTLMVSPRYRRILAVVVSYESPSYRSCMAVIRECVRRHNRLPKVVVTDNGSDFRSAYFKALTRRFDMVHAFRPGGKPQWGSVLERMNLTINFKLLRNLPGCSDLMKAPRNVSASHQARNLAILPLEELAHRTQKFCYEFWDTTAHGITGRSPRVAFQEAMKAGGPRSHKIIVYNDDFLLLTMPTTTRRQAKISNRQGVTINHIPYRHAALKEERHHGRKVHVRYDPYDYSHAWVKIDGDWLECKNLEFAYLFNGLSEKEIRLASTSLLGAAKTLKTKRRAINAKTLAAFFHHHCWRKDLQLAAARAARNKRARGVNRGSRGKAINHPPVYRSALAAIPKAGALRSSSGLKGFAA